MPQPEVITNCNAMIDQLDNSNFKNEILLTGAGFTKNFGGFLSDEMWAEIFNNPELQKYQRLKNAFFQELNYEVLYEEILYGNIFNEEERKAFHNAFVEAYRKIDNAIRSINVRGGPINLDGLDEFLSKFCGENGKKGFIFTLNQDLFIERKSRTVKPFIRLGVTPKIVWNESQYSSRELTENEYLKINTREQDQIHLDDHLKNHDSYYVKLHGSCDWITEEGYLMITGRGRGKMEEIISKQPLSFYLELFKKALDRKNVKLVIIGYGFGDYHINKIIFESVAKHQTKLYVFCPLLFRKFREDLQNRELENRLAIIGSKRIHEWVEKGLSGYFYQRFEDIFTGDPGRKSTLKNIENSIFDS